MASLYFKPHFYFKGNGWNSILKLIAEKVFFGMRNDWVNQVNPLIEQVNKEWDHDFPNADLQEEKWSTVYDAYMAKNKPENLWFRGEANPKTGDFRLVRKNNPNMYVDYDMEVTGYHN